MRISVLHIVLTLMYYSSNTTLMRKFSKNYGILDNFPKMGFSFFKIVVPSGFHWNKVLWPCCNSQSCVN